MKNAEKFQEIFKEFATEVWAFSEKDFLTWLNAEYGEPTTKNDLGVDKEQLKTMIRGLMKWYVKRDNTEVGEPNTAVGLLYDDVMFGIDRLPSVIPQEPKTGKWISTETKGVRYAFWCRYKCSLCGGLSASTTFCPNCGARMVEPQESEDK